MSESQESYQPARIIEVDPDLEGQRIDNFLMCQLKGVPKSYVYRIVRTGEVRVNKGRIKAAYRIKGGDLIRVPPMRLSAQTELKSPGSKVLERLKKSILYEDERILVINKPSGLAVHGGSGLNYGAIEALRALYPDERNLELVHRLDRDTSGCLLISKKRSALRALHELIRNGKVDKRYWALLSGRFPGKSMDVSVPLLKNTLKSGERLVRVDSEGKASRTGFHLIRRLNGASLLEARLYTGRTHQIRVHAHHIKFPILGDQKYGSDTANAHWKKLGLKRMFLHARSLAFRWPGESEMCRFEAPLDKDLDALLKKYCMNYEV